MISGGQFSTDFVCVTLDHLENRPKGVARQWKFMLMTNHDVSLGFLSEVSKAPFVSHALQDPNMGLL